MERGNPTDRYSARIKQVFIELHEYAYFHSPSEIGNLDRRFTGRKAIIERLKSLFMDYETPSGAYLVTGYRGAGKSSLVAHALSEISARPQQRRRSSRYLRLIVPMPAIALIGGFMEWPFTLSALFATIVLFLNRLQATDPRFPDLLVAPSRREDSSRSLRIFKSLLWVVYPRIFARAEKPGLAKALSSAKRRSFARTFYIDEEPSPRRRAWSLAQDLLIIMIVVLVVTLGTRWLEIESYTVRLLAYSEALLLYLLSSSFLGIVRSSHLAKTPHPDKRAGASKEEKRELPNPWRVSARLWRWFLDELKRYSRPSSRIHIQINLSQDQIKEIDILRLIAKNLHLKYKQYHKDWRTEFVWKILRASLLFLAVVVVYNLGTVYRLNCGLKHELHIPCYFPSQGAYLLEGGVDTYFETIDRMYGEGTFSAHKLREALELLPKSIESERLREGGHLFRHESRRGFAGKVQEHGMAFANYLDTFTQGLSHQFHGVIPRSLREKRIESFFRVNGLRGDIALVPRHLDYLFFFYLFLTWVVVRQVLRWPQIGLTSHRLIIRRLEELNEVIDTRVTRERTGVPVSLGSSVLFNLGRRKSLTYGELTARDIEKHLLEIMGLVERIPRLTSRPEFVFVFDELDKIQHHANFTLSEKDKEIEDYQGHEFRSTEAERARQHHILSLVSNLKHFLTTAPAKFIFIAGREMFDASLADVSDRHFFMGSVFNQVLHVPSFLSDDSDDRLPDITSLTEQYLCRFLIPRHHQEEDGGRPSLRMYHRYLVRELIPGTHEEARRRREKVIYELHNFITYVTYRSNGAPKKITKAVERFLVRLTPDLQNHPDAFIVGKSSNRFYLRFDYYDQYTFGLVTYLASPLIFSLNRSIKDYGDKVLVSSSFLLDHVYKFHGHGFSWRNLELLPEIVDINRAPQLRELIRYIMQFLAKSDISEIASGLYDFKFTRRITEEIAFLSKVSEDESAAFNFTLDESLAIKRHFNRKLKALLGDYDEYPNSEKESFVNSVSLVRMILGDLHYYDGELDAAIVEYMEAIQSLRDIKLEDIRVDILVLMVRNFLKLGLAFERKKSLDSALVTYGRISALVSQVAQRVRDLPGKSLSEKTLHPTERGYYQSALEGSRMLLQPMFARLQVIEKLTLGGISPADLKNVESEFEVIISGDQAKDRYLVEAEFNNKTGDILFFKNGPLPGQATNASGQVTNAYCHSREALCERNKDWERLTQELRRLPCAACSSYHGAVRTLCRHYLGFSRPRSPCLPIDIFEALEQGRTEVDSASSLMELGTTLSNLGDTFLGCNGALKIDQTYLMAVIYLLGTDSEDRASARESMPLSGRLRAAVRERGTLQKIEEAITYYIAAAILFKWASNSRACARELTKVLWVIREFLAVGGRNVDGQKFSRDLISLLNSPLVHVTLEENYRSHEGTHRLEIEKIKEILEIHEGSERPFVESVNLGRLSINASVTEILVLLDEINLSLVDRGRAVPIDNHCSPFMMFQSVFSRIHSLRLRTRINYHNLRALGFVTEERGSWSKRAGLWLLVERRELVGTKLVEAARAFGSCLQQGPIDPEAVFGDGTAISRQEALEFLITDSIYCLHEILRFMAIYGTSYMASHSMRAAAHKHLARWCDFYYAYLRFHNWLNDDGWCKSDEEKEERRGYLRAAGRGSALLRLEEKLRQLVGQADMVELGPSYHEELALLHFRSALEAHSEGKAYRELLGEMFYLDDDFADQLEHFCAGLERFRINSRRCDDDIEELKRQLRKTSVYDSSRYRRSGGAVHGVRRSTELELSHAQERSESTAPGIELRLPVL